MIVLRRTDTDLEGLKRDFAGEAETREMPIQVLGKRSLPKVSSGVALSHHSILCTVVCPAAQSAQIAEEALRTRVNRTRLCVRFTLRCSEDSEQMPFGRKDAGFCRQEPRRERSQQQAECGVRCEDRDRKAPGELKTEIAHPKRKHDGAHKEPKPCNNPVQQAEPPPACTKNQDVNDSETCAVPEVISPTGKIGGKGRSEGKTVQEQHPHQPGEIAGHVAHLKAGDANDFEPYGRNCTSEPTPDNRPPDRRHQFPAQKRNEHQYGDSWKKKVFGGLSHGSEASLSGGKDQWSH